MRTIAALVVASSVALLAACSTVSEPLPGPAPSPVTAPAVVRAPGDVAPAQLYRVALPDVPRDLVQASLAASPRDLVAFPADSPAATQHTETVRVVMPGASPTAYSIAVDDTTDDTVMFLSVRSDDAKIIDAALRDVTVVDPNGNQVNRRQQKLANGQYEGNPMAMVTLTGMPTGAYVVKLGALASKAGVTIDVRQPKSPIVMSLQPSVSQLLLGNDGEVAITLSEGGQPVTGASVQGTLVAPDGSAGPSVTFTDAGGGRYRASLAPAFTQSSALGAWNVRVSASGVSPNGAAFERSGETAVHFGVPTARITGVTQTRTVTDAAGNVSGWDVDVGLDVASLDRYEVSATLAAVGPDGKEHPVGVAHATRGLDAGSRTLTLHFDAGWARMTTLEGTYLLRNLQLYSLGTNTLFHRAGYGLNQRFDGVRRATMTPPTTIPPMVDQLIREGALAP